MRQSHPPVFKIDITQIEGDGDFSCPKCGVKISPDDETETVYTIINTKVKRQNLEELDVLCNNCGNRIRLVGFLKFKNSEQMRTTEKESQR